MTNWMRPVALALIAVTAAGCGQAAGGYDGSACVAARDASVIEGRRWLSDIEVSGGRDAALDRAVFDTLFDACSADPEAAYSDFLVRTHAAFEAVTPAGEVARRQFLNAGCGEQSPYPVEALSAQARTVCTGG